jgi:hypothetical protein
MNGPQHWEEADLILSSDLCEYGCPHAGCPHEMRMLARAQVHATLATAAVPVEAEDTRRLDRIRVVLARFDWEHDDRQLALEEIERIADGSQP